MVFIILRVGERVISLPVLDTKGVNRSLTLILVIIIYMANRYYIFVAQFSMLFCSSVNVIGSVRAQPLASSKAIVL